MTRSRMLFLVSALAFLTPTVRCEQPTKTARISQEDRIKKLEERADAAEKAASNAAMEKDYITRTQKQYESYYEKVLNTQMWTLGMMGLLLTGVFVLVARFSLKMIDEQTKTATAGATVQMRNEYARAMAKEVQKLWDSNAADVKKLRESLSAQFAELEQNLKHRTEFQMQLVRALGEGFEERQSDALASLREALRSYKAGKGRKLIEAKMGATAIQYIFESLRKAHPDNYVQKAREEFADPLYNELEEELALAALQSTWLTPLIKERNPVPPEIPAPLPEPVVERRTAPLIETPSADVDLTVGEEYDSCRLITT